MEAELIYLDHQASTPMHPRVVAAMRASVVENFANPHSSEHAFGWADSEAVEQARASVAEAIGADPDEVVFTSGATEADNMALLGFGYPTGPRRRIVIGAIEHKAVIGPARELARRGYEVVKVSVTPNGVVDTEELEQLINEDTLLVSLMLVNNEIGTVQPVQQAAAVCAREGALLHIDAAQALGWMPLDTVALGADFMSLSAHKMGGPKGVGALFVRREVRQRIQPIMYGGEQEDGLRPGTLPTPLCVAFGVACEELPDEGEVAAWRERSRRLEAGLLALWRGAWINGADALRHPGAISVTFPGLPADQLVARLQPHVAVSRGSACTSGIPEPSHVLRAIGLTQDLCDATIRVSVGRFTQDREIENALSAFAYALSCVSGHLTGQISGA